MLLSSHLRLFFFCGMITSASGGPDTSGELQQCAVYINSSGITHQCTLYINSPIVMLLDSAKGTPQRILISFYRPGNASYELIGECNKNCNGNITAVGHSSQFEVIHNSLVLNNLGKNDSGQYKISVLYKGETETYYEELNVTFIERPTDAPDLTLSGENPKHEATERSTDAPDLTLSGENSKHEASATRNDNTRVVCIFAAVVVILFICCVWNKTKKETNGREAENQRKKPKEKGNALEKESLSHAVHQGKSRRVHQRSHKDSSEG